MSQNRSSRRTFAKFIAAALVAGVGCVGAAYAQNYPTKPITLIVP